ncbi:MAG: hypothetical protein KatS3mg110_0571 [Pirellulaceae bacterium]|nr:MAG: hypothetical protein KatS3mg110_0571 [Pirellulaceae bacterium]
MVVVKPSGPLRLYRPERPEEHRKGGPIRVDGYRRYAGIDSNKQPMQRCGDRLMKTRWARLIPGVWTATLCWACMAEAQVNQAPVAGNGPQAVQASQSRQTPLGIPSTLGKTGPAAAVSGPAVAPAGFPAPMPPGWIVGPDGVPVMIDPLAPPVAPASYGAEWYGPGPMVDPAYDGDYDPSIGGRAERGFDLLKRLGPYPGGGWCSPRWFDVAADFMYLTREEVSRRVNFTSDGPAGLGEPFIVLSTDNLDFDHEPGFRFQAAVQFGASSNIEFTYFGLFNFAKSAAVVSDTDDLYSVFSDFGTNPPPQAGPPIVRGGFTDTDSAEFHSIEYSSNFDTLELGFRRRWMAPNCRIQGSWLAGVRYFRLEEQFIHRTRVNYPDPNDPSTNITGFMDYFVGTANSMTGFQVGGDLWATLFPGIQVGSELKAGIYGNRADQRTTIDAQTLTLPVEESARHDAVAFLAEANLTGTWRLGQHLTARGGYTLLYVDGVALAPENFNPEPPFVAGARTVFINDNGDVFYHGFTAGLEWMW